ADRSYETLDVINVIIDVEGCAGRRGDAEPPHQRLGAMMARADADAVPVENRGQVVRMDVAVGEGHDAGPVVPRTVDGDPLDLREPLDRDSGELLFVLGNVFQTQLLEIGNRRRQP